eukprot:3054078-Lingulodinium_polyedra.AAC.1
MACPPRRPEEVLDGLGRGHALRREGAGLGEGAEHGDPLEEQLPHEPSRREARLGQHLAEEEDPLALEERADVWVRSLVEPRLRGLQRLRPLAPPSELGLPVLQDCVGAAGQDGEDRVLDVRWELRGCREGVLEGLGGLQEALRVPR